MGTHPIFESDFDCLTDMLSIGSLSKSLRSLHLTTDRSKQIKAGFGIIHGKHQLPYWEGTKMTTRRTRDGYDMEWAEYTPKPFMMKNLKGRQPASEYNLIKYAEGYGSEYNTELKKNALA